MNNHGGITTSGGVSRTPDGAAPPRTPWIGTASWAVYDWASNAYSTIILTFVFARYFTDAVAVDHQTGTLQWGVTLTVAGIFVGFGGPLLGATVDHTGRRKPLMAFFTAMCVVAMTAMWFVKPDPTYIWLALALLVFGEIGLEYATILYNAMLPRLVPEHRVGRWSGWGWSMGYAGGLLCLVLSLLGFVMDDPWLPFPKDEAQHVRATFILAAAWYLVFAVPLFLFTPDAPRTGKRLRTAFRDGAMQLWNSILQVRRFKHIIRFLIARLIYIDALGTIFTFGGIYAAGTFDMDEKQVLLFGIALNISAGLGALSFSWLDDWMGSKRTILLSLIGLVIPGTAMLIVESTTLFWIFGLMLGIFVGPVQAASRSFMAHLAPPDLRNQMFGLYAFSGKAAFFCPSIVGLLTWFSGSQRIGMSAVMVFFAVGFLILLGVPARRPPEPTSRPGGALPVETNDAP